MDASAAATAKIEPDPERGSGHALVRVPAGAAARADPRFRLAREGYDAGILGPDGWQVADALLAPLAAAAVGPDLLLAVGPDVVNRVEAGTVRLRVPACGFDAPVFWPDLPLSPQQGTARIPITPRSQPDGIAGAIPPHAPAAGAVEADRPQPAAAQPAARPIDLSPYARPRATPRARRSRGPGLALLLVLLALGGGVWWRSRGAPPADPRPGPTADRAPPTPMPQTPAQTPASAPSPAAAPAASGPAEAGCETRTATAQIVTCTQTPDALYAVAAARWDGHQADQAIVLMEIAADRGSGAAALRLARIYDPTGFQPGGPIRAPNPRQSAMYYRQAIQRGLPAAAAPRAALKTWLEGARDNGDPMARLTLRDFWP